MSELLHCVVFLSNLCRESLNIHRICTNPSGGRVPSFVLQLKQSVVSQSIMEKSIYVSIAFGVLFSLQIMVQQNQLQGLEAKNYKPWETTNYGKTMMVEKRKQTTRSEAKNEKPCESKVDLTPIEFSAKRKLTGARAKNRRPERNNTNRMFDN